MSIDGVSHDLPTGARDSASKQGRRRRQLLLSRRCPLGAQQDREHRGLHNACVYRLECHHEAQKRWVGICKYTMLLEGPLPNNFFSHDMQTKVTSMKVKNADGGFTRNFKISLWMHCWITVIGNLKASKIAVIWKGFLFMRLILYFFAIL